MARDKAKSDAKYQFIPYPYKTHDEEIAVLN